MNRSEFISMVNAYVGVVEGSRQHLEILRIYNEHEPLARGYRIKDTDAWCACFVSAMSIKANLTDIIPTEVGCNQMIALFQKLGEWVEADSYRPRPGDAIFFDWEDDGVGDNRGSSNHVGIVQRVEGSTIYTVEGNFRNRVGVRQLLVNGKYIRGYGVPKFEETPATKPVGGCQITLPMLRYGDNGSAVRTLQIMLKGYGYNIGRWGADGEIGKATFEAVKRFQKNNHLEVDGICGVRTWQKLLE